MTRTAEWGRRFRIGRYIIVLRRWHRATVGAQFYRCPNRGPWQLTVDCGKFELIVAS